jgi:hypothetical protein
MLHPVYNMKTTWKHKMIIRYTVCMGKDNMTNIGHLLIQLTCSSMNTIFLIHIRTTPRLLTPFLLTQFCCYRYFFLSCSNFVGNQQLIIKPSTFQTVLSFQCCIWTNSLVCHVDMKLSKQKLLYFSSILGMGQDFRLWLVDSNSLLYQLLCIHEHAVLVR